jgi:hypothetical protein
MVVVSCRNHHSAPILATEITTYQLQHHAGRRLCWGHSCMSPQYCCWHLWPQICMCWGQSGSSSCRQAAPGQRRGWMGKLQHLPHAAGGVCILATSAVPQPNAGCCSKSVMPELPHMLACRARRWAFSSRASDRDLVCPAEQAGLQEKDPHVISPLALTSTLQRW